MSVHPSAVVGSRASIAADAEIGPFCVIDGEVEIGAGTVIESNARIGSRYGRVKIGAHNYIQHGAVLGGPPQDHSYQAGAYTALEIGDHNRSASSSSINSGTDRRAAASRACATTTSCMAYSHVGHDCQLAEHIVHRERRAVRRPRDDRAPSRS
jgi:UDP-N-acetylglucosamine acyltransferase